MPFLQKLLEAMSNFHNRASFAPNLRYLFSGLMACGECGSSFVIVAKGRFGCSASHTRGKAVCKNSATVSHHIVEERLLSGLKEHMLSDEAFDLFSEHVESLMSQKKPADTKLVDKQLRASEKEHTNLMNAIKRGIYTDSIKRELQTVEARIDELKATLPSSVKPLPIKRVLPKARERFQSAIKHLEGTLSAHANIAREQLKQLIEGKILVHPTGDGLEAELHAKTPEFLAKSMGKEFGLVVAGAAIGLFR